jgi:hypothetical protein
MCCTVAAYATVSVYATQTLSAALTRTYHLSAATLLTNSYSKISLLIALSPFKPFFQQFY